MGEAGGFKGEVLCRRALGRRGGRVCWAEVTRLRWDGFAGRVGFIQRDQESVEEEKHLEKKGDRFLEALAQV